MGEVIIIVPQHYTTIPQKQTKKNYHKAIVWSALAKIN